jgi:hypothetical protein
MLALMKLREKHQEAVETAECRLMPNAVCAEPRPVEQCPWGPTRFCGARLRDEAAAGVVMDLDWRRRERQEHAEECRIPRAMWDLIGVSTGHTSEAFRVTEPMRFLEYAIWRKLAVVHGADGTGKTTAAALWCWKKKGWYYRATNLKWWSRGAGWNTNPDDTKLLAMHAVAIVGLDKPWAGKDGAHRHNLIHILHQRLDAGKFTLITSNLGLAEVEGLLGPSLARSVRKWNALGTVTTQLDGEQEKEETF